MTTTTTTTAIKPLTIVLTTSGWAVRQRCTDGTDLFIINPDGYMLHEAIAVHEGIRRGGDLSNSFKPLPAGTQVLTKLSRVSRH